MANRYPLVVDTTNGNKIREIPNGDNLQLTGNSVIGVVDVTASGTVSANEINATSIKKGGIELATVAVTGAFSDITGGPTQLSDLTDDLNVLVPGDNVGTLTNNVGYLTTVAFADLTATPTTLAGYGITDAATAAQGGLASTAVQPGASVSVLLNDAGYVTSTQLTDGSLTVDVNNSGDLIGSVFGDDSTILVDSILSAVNLDGTIRGHVRPNANQHNLWDLGTDAVRFKDAYFSGTVNDHIIGRTVEITDASTITGSRKTVTPDTHLGIELTTTPTGSPLLTLPDGSYNGQTYFVTENYQGGSSVDISVTNYWNKSTEAIETVTVTGAATGAAQFVWTGTYWTKIG